VSKAYCLAAVEASFYQLCRGLLLPFTVVLGYYFLHPRPTYNSMSLSGVGIVILGFTWSVFTDGRIIGGTSTKGMLLGVGSSFVTAMEGLTIKRLVFP
jgi:solute carrier family 35 (GDP-fucose transporter), member C1